MPNPQGKAPDTLVEACVDSVTSALAAQAAGARRLELCASLNDAGVTPSAGMISAVLAQVDIPTFIIIRPRGGGFVYSQSELDVMLRDIDAARGLGVHGIVVGALTEDEVFVTCKRANAGVTFENTGTEPLVGLRYFGPDAQPNAPGNGAWKS